jgi:hypothetical protein
LVVTAPTGTPWRRVELYSSISIQDAYGWCPEHGVRVPTVQVHHRCDDTM